MVGRTNAGGGSTFSAQINVTNAVPNTIVTATSSAGIYTATADENGVALIDIIKKGTYTLTNSGRYSPSAVIVDSAIVYSARMASVPSEYQEVEYLQSSGTQYINIPSITLAFHKRIVCKANRISGLLFGEGPGNERMMLLNSGGILFDQTGAPVGGTVPANEVHEVEYVGTNGARKGYMDGNLIVSDTRTWSNGNSVYALFAGNNGGTIRNKFTGKLYFFKLFKEDHTTLEFDMYPCYRKSDNVAGMWDEVEKKFYTNAGSGTFIVGEPI